MGPSYVLSVLSPPAGLSDDEARSRGKRTLLVGLVILVAGIAVLTAAALLPRATAETITDATRDRVTYVHGSPMSTLSAVIYAVIFPAGLGYLMVVAGLFRWMLGMPSANAGVRFLRKAFGFILFCVTFIVSLIGFGFVLQLVNP